MHPKIRRVRTVATIPQNSGAVTIAAPDGGLSGLLRGYTITAPSMTAASYSFALLGAQGESLYSVSSLSPSAVTITLKDAGSLYLAVPFTKEPAENFFIITGASEGGSTGILTSNQTNALSNETVTIGSVVYTFVTSLSGTANEILIASNTAATGTLTSNNTNVSDGDTVTLGGTTYRFKNTMAQINDVHIGGSADASLTSLAAAINHGGTPGTDYFTGTVANASATSSAVASHILTFTAIVAGPSGATIALAKSAATLSVNAATLTGGSYAGDTTLAHLVSAINASAGAGSTYGTGTTANPDVTSGSVTSHAITLTSTAVPDVAVTTSTSAAFTWGATHLTGGGEASARTFTVDLYIEK